MIRLLPIFLILIYSSAFGATGDVLYSNCFSGGSCTGANSSNPGWTRTVETTGCQSGSCLKLVGNFNPSLSNPDRYGATNTSISTSGANGENEITVSYWCKFDEAAVSISNGNIKQFIALVGGSSIRFPSVIVPHFGWDFYQHHVDGDFTKASWFSPHISSAYVIDNGDGTYSTATAYMEGRADGTGHPTRPGTDWVKFTHYIKLPSTTTSSDGVVKVWLNDELMVDFYNAKFYDYGSQTAFTGFTFYSSSEADEAFEHWMDEMVIYEGYVPPVADSTPPTMTSGTVAGTIATVTANESIVTTGYDSGDLQLVCSTAGTVNLSSPTGSGATRTLTAASSVGAGDSCTLSGTLTSGDITDISGNSMVSFSGVSVSVNTANYTLTVSKNGTGAGTVVADSGAINCGATCSDDYVSGTIVTLTPTADGSSTFVGWSGCDSISGSDCIKTMDDDYTVTATFNATPESCDASHLWLCTDGPCQSAGGYFYESMCYEIAEPAGETIYTNDFSSWDTDFDTYTSSSVSQLTGAVQVYGTIHSSAIYRTFPGIGTYTFVAWIRNISTDFEIWTAYDDSQFFNVADGVNQTVTGTITYNGSGDTHYYLQSPVDGGAILIDSLILKEPYNPSTTVNSISGAVIGGEVH